MSVALEDLLLFLLAHVQPIKNHCLEESRKQVLLVLELLRQE